MQVNNGGTIAFAGYNWGIKDSGGGAVGPGPNVFSGDSNFVWTDALGEEPTHCARRANPGRLSHHSHCAAVAAGHCLQACI